MFLVYTSQMNAENNIFQFEKFDHMTKRFLSYLVPDTPGKMTRVVKIDDL